MEIFLVYLTINWHQSGYNYGLGYIASLLKENGHNVNYIIIQESNDIRELYERIKFKKPEIIGFYVTTSQFFHLKEIVRTIKKISNSFVVCGGPHPTFEPESIFEISGLDAVVRGEGEFAMLDLAEALEHNTDYRFIKNFWFQTKDGVVKNEVRPLIKNLDDLPFPDKSSLDYQHEIDKHAGINRFIFSRGCTFECTYCSNKAYTDIYNETFFRMLSPQKAIKEIELDEIEYEFNMIIFDDDTINLNEEWFFEFFSLYKKKFRYPFICNMRPDIISENDIKLLKEAGVNGIWIGVEHGNENFRKSILKRNITDNEIITAFRLAYKYNIKCYPQIMVGLPFENKNLFLDTVKLCRKLPKAATDSISIYFPYPSTELGELCKEKNWLPDKNNCFERKEATISYPEFRKEEIQLCADVFHILMLLKFISLKIPLKIIYYIFVYPRKLIISYIKNIHITK